MADTSVFEVARQTHEEVERYTQAAVDAVASSSSSDVGKEKLRRQHQISNVLDRVVYRNAYLHGFYNDALGDNQREIEAIGGQENGMKEFYHRLNKIREYHKKYPDATPEAFSIDLDDLDGVGANGTDFVMDKFDQLFSGEEMGGRFLDLYTQHDLYLNLKGVRRISYLQYLDQFDKLRGSEAKITSDVKRTEAYRRYLHELQSYLLNFMRRTRPVSDVDAFELIALANFEEAWENGKVTGWEDQGESVFGHGSRPQTDASSGQGIWCEACQRSFAKQTVFDGHLNGAKHIKAAERMSSKNKSAESATHPNAQAQEVERQKRKARAKAIARDETVIIAMGSELHTVRAETRANVERKAALTERERQAEAEAATEDTKRAEEAVQEDADNDDEDDEKIYNPLKLPLGWDGKPIPFWLYKLHGLSKEFKCEICSDYVYQGRKNFERHFSESRHAFGMRALGLPNTKHFYEIVSIKDALALAEKLKQQGRVAAEERDDAEEVEDEHGNTYTKKTYELLKRQGLL